MKNLTLRPEPVLSDIEGRLGGEISESFFTTDQFMYQWVQHSGVLSAPRRATRKPEEPNL